MLYRTRLHASANAATVLARVEAVTDPDPDLGTRFKSAFRMGARPGEKPFVGRVEGSSFKILRRIYYRNSFRPQIRGAVSDESGGSHVDLTMMISPVVVVFLLVWFGMMSVFASIALREILPSAGGWRVIIMLAAGLAILALGWALFFFEALKARRLLEQAIGPKGGSSCP
jgi:hypothetical protein